MSTSWMPTMVATLLVVVIAMLALSLGLLLGRGQPRGTCGRSGGACVCRGDEERCPASVEVP